MKVFINIRKYDEGGPFNFLGNYAGLANTGLDFLDLGADLLAQKANNKKLEEEVRKTKAFTESLNSSIDKKAAGYAAAQKFDRAGSTALTAGLAAMQNIPKYMTGTPTNRIGSGIDNMTEGITSIFNGGLQVLKDYKDSKVAKAVEVEINQATAGNAIDSSQQKVLTGTMGKTAQVPPVNQTSSLAGNMANLAISAKHGGLIPKGSIGWSAIANGAAKTTLGLTEFIANNKQSDFIEHLSRMSNSTNTTMQNINNTVQSAMGQQNQSTNSNNLQYNKPIEVKIVDDRQINTGAPNQPEQPTVITNNLQGHFGNIPNDSEKADEIAETVVKKELRGGNLKHKFEILDFYTRKN